MKESLHLMECILKDVSIKSSAMGGSKDMKTIRRRVHNEGLSFLTITLPNFSSTFFQCLEKGVVTSFDFQGWKKKGYLPAFLQGFTSLIFDQHTGVLQYEPNIESIHAIRQICNLFKKVDIPCTSERVQKTLKQYMDTDCNLGLDPFSGDAQLYELFRNVSSVVVSSICGSEIDESSLIPHHGPGSTEERLVMNKKFILSNFHWYSQLDNHFDRSCVMNTEESYGCSSDDYKATLPCSSVRVITVPKTQKGPRIIAMEPVVIQFTQQSIKDFLVKKIESSPLTSGHINFKDQKINQELALTSSVTRAFATLDMTEASDRVCAKHVYQMLSVHPQLRSLVFSTRSHFANVLGKQICLNKFASMGSALCFPIESLYFFIVIMTSILKRRGLQPTYKNIYSLSRGVHVYGDDIIIPVNEADFVVSTLAKFGNVVSLEKSFKNSHFRESCGVDAYKGVNITPTYVRHMLPRKRQNTKAIVSLVETANQFFDKQLYTSYAFIQEHIEKIVGNLPAVSDTSPGLGWRLTFSKEKERFNRKLQRYEVSTFVPYTIRKKDSLRDYNALSKCLLNLERKEPISDRRLEFHHSLFARKENEKLINRYRDKAHFQDREHLDLSPVRGALALKRRWVLRS